MVRIFLLGRSLVERTFFANGPDPRMGRGLLQKTNYFKIGNLQGAFFKCSAQFSVLKRKSLLNQRGSFVHREFHGRESLIGCPSSYLIIVIFFTLTQFLENKIYTEKRQFFALYL